MEAGAGPRVAALHDSLKPQVERYSRIYVYSFANEIENCVAKHDAVIEAVEEGLGSVADAAMRRNWHNAAERLCRHIHATGARGNWQEA